MGWPRKGLRAAERYHATASNSVPGELSNIHPSKETNSTFKNHQGTVVAMDLASRYRGDETRTLIKHAIGFPATEACRT